MNRPPIQLLPFLRGTAIRRGALFGGILLGALLAFEVFNYSTTDFALHDVLGDLRFAGLRWSTILSLAFCGIDFAGIARRSLVSVWRLAVGCGYERLSHLVGCFGCHYQPLPGGQCFCKSNHDDQSNTGLCGNYGLADPRTDHWNLLRSG